LSFEGSQGTCCSDTGLVPSIHEPNRPSNTVSRTVETVKIQCSDWK